VALDGQKHKRRDRKIRVVVDAVVRKVVVRLRFNAVF
jgi:hypothetical protein